MTTTDIEPTKRERALAVAADRLPEASAADILAAAEWLLDEEPGEPANTADPEDITTPFTSPAGLTFTFSTKELNPEMVALFMGDWQPAGHSSDEGVTPCDPDNGDYGIDMPEWEKQLYDGFYGQEGDDADLRAVADRILEKLAEDATPEPVFAIYGDCLEYDHVNDGAFVEGGEVWFCQVDYDPADFHPVPEPEVDGGVFVLDWEGFDALPEGTRYSQAWDGYFSSHLESSTSPTPLRPKGLYGPRRILNPEVLGEFHPVTHLEGSADYERAPIGTLVGPSSPGHRGAERVEGGWMFGGSLCPSDLLFSRREILRWGPAPKPFKVGDVLGSEEAYVRAEVGTTVGAWAGSTATFTKLENGLWQIRGLRLSSAWMGDLARTVTGVPA